MAVGVSLVGGPKNNQTVEVESPGGILTVEGSDYHPSRVEGVYVYGGPEGSESGVKELRVGEGFRKALPDHLKGERYESLVQELKGFAVEVAGEDASIVNSNWEDTIITFDEEDETDDKIIVLRALLSLPASFEEGEDEA